MRAKKSRKKYIALIILVLVLLFIAIILLSKELQKAAYPLKYQDIILKNAAQYNIDPYLIAGIIHTESRFDALAVSPKGARGLMQIMPETGSWIAQKLDLDNYSDELLFQPEENIRIGCWYLSFISGRFSQDLTAILAGYNAGHGKVTQWLLNEEYAPGGKLKTIPFKETEIYIERVLHATQRYRDLYDF